jgi:hypothetical protein
MLWLLLPLWIAMAQSWAGHIRIGTPQITIKAPEGVRFWAFFQPKKEVQLVVRSLFYEYSRFCQTTVMNKYAEELFASIKIALQ